MTGGGGGFGDPRDRDRQRVLDDVRNRHLTREAARASYGVEVES
jgi:N-methylhydantoinase B